MKTRKIRISFVLALLLIVNQSTTSLANMEDNDFLEEKLSNLIENDPILKGAIAGVSIRSSSTGKMVYEHLGDVRLRPASNLKLLTAGVALSVLGEGYTFSTELLTDGQIVGNMLFGNLFLKGKGDPTLLKADFDLFAEQLIQKGVSVIHGDLIGDDTWYDNVRHSIDLPWSDEHTYYGAQISALTSSPDKDYDAGTVIVNVLPAKKIGHPAVVTISPKTDYMRIVNKAKTVQADGKKDIVIKREHGTNTLQILGAIPVHSQKVSDWISVSNPTGYALDLFKQSLVKKGIALNGRVKEGMAPDSATLIMVHPSMPLSDLLVPFMKLSNNVHGETLIKEMGKVHKGIGSWEKGLEVLEEELIKLGVNSNNLVLRDGSGISHLNLVPANEISKLLFSIQKKPWFPTFLHSLPVNGENAKMVGGTLRHRMKQPSMKGKIKAKTGTLTTVSSLSGFIESNSGETLIFSIILNNLMDEEKAKDLEDRIVSILVNY